MTTGQNRSATVGEILDWMKATGTEENRAGMARYAINAPRTFGISVAALRDRAKQIGRNHALALELWKTGWYEARMLAAFVDEPARVTPGQMNAWCEDFDNWAICDSVCFHLFDKTPHAFAKVDEWSTSEREFVKRAAFALLASLSTHDKKAPNSEFSSRLPLIEAAAIDGRNFVKKSVSWALRGIGKRNPELHAGAKALAERLAASGESAARWIGRDTLKDLSSPATGKRLERAAGRTGPAKK